MREISYAATGLDKSLPHIMVIMDKRDTAEYVRFPLADGYSFAMYTPQRRADWCELHYSVGHFDSTEDADACFEREFMSQPELLPQRMVFVLAPDGTAAATASFWPGSDFGEGGERVHWVAVSPNHQNKGLSKALITKVLDLYNEQGYRDYIYLITQTWSYKAIGVYAAHGFKPYLDIRPSGWKMEGAENDAHADELFRKQQDEAWKMIADKQSGYNKK